MKPIEIPKSVSPAGDKSSSNPHISDHLANERTYLAYLRTAIALISFGITVNRFSLFLIQSKEASEKTVAHFDLLGVSRVGFGMVVFGLLLMLWAASHASKVSRQIDRGEFRTSMRGIWVITLSVLAIGGISLIWLFPR